MQKPAWKTIEIRENRMKNYTGRIHFYKDTKYGFIVSFMEDDHGNVYTGDDYLFLGMSDVISVDLSEDTREAEIEMLEKEVKQKSADHQVWLNTMAGKIQLLQAIEHKEPVE